MTNSPLKEITVLAHLLIVNYFTIGLSPLFTL